MRKFLRLLLLWSLILSACSAIPAAPQTVSPGTTEPPTSLPTTAVPDPQNCGYQWAYQDLPELSSSFQQSLQALQPQAQATAFAFGENCILADGSIGGFLPMETDFNITLQVRDLNNEADLGEWIMKVMQVITEIPPEQIVGPRPGRVSLTFQSGENQKVVNFYINQYQELPAGLSAAEIFQQLQIPQ
ncbi:MAG TPA: hypothetical protein VJ821_17505 [Anaerolineales bacterium]|nr:hypothetical protein [Anaerolineales bacterium]